MKNQHLFIWNDRLYDSFYIIKNEDIHAGFCAIMLYVLNGVRKATELNAIPVVDFNKNNTPDFYNKKYGESIWEYFFEPISLYTFDNIHYFLKKGYITANKIHQPTCVDVMRMHHDEEDRLATFWAKKTPLYKEKWIEEKRSLGRSYIEKYIRVNQNIVEKVNCFTKSHFKHHSVIGVHIRGTDFAYASPTKIDSYFEEIDRLMQKNKDIQFFVFLATDQKQYLETFKDRYKDKLFYIDALRSENHIAPFRLELNNGYRKGEDVLLDIMILSKCNHIIKGAAAVGEIALWFNNCASISDFAIQSEFYQKPYHKLEATFSKFNIGKHTPSQLALNKFRLSLIRKIQDSVIGKKLFIKFKFVRKLLKH